MNNPETVNSNSENETSLSREKAEGIGEAALKAAREHLVHQAEETGEHFAKDVKITERQFAEQLKRSSEKGENHVPEKEFLVWEKEAGDSWGRMQAAEHDARLGTHDRAVLEVETIVYPNPSECDKTIEAQSGNFYFARMRRLVDAIREAGGDEGDLEKTEKFPDAVSEHLRFKFTPRDELRDEFDTGNPTTTWQRVDEARNRAHNASIQALNGLNELAEKYGTPRFTFRNFHTKGYLENLPPEEDAIAENDRACVEAFYSFAFKSEVARLNARQRRSSAYGLY